MESVTSSHHDDINRLAASAALLVIRRSQHHGLNIGTEALERHHPIDHLQWVALRRNRRKPLVRIEKSQLPHRPHLCESCRNESDSHKLAEAAIFRGALVFTLHFTRQRALMLIKGQRG
jgi:hypothetical protein